MENELSKLDSNLNKKILALALEHHKTVDGCAIEDCPRVRQLVIFGAQCAMEAVDEAQRIVRLAGSGWERPRSKDSSAADEQPSSRTIG